MSQPVLVNVVLDKSGSMLGLQRATIEGFNSFLHEQQQQDGDCRLSLTQFDTNFQVDYVGRDIREVPMLDTMSYRPAGGTALLDAVGTAIKGAEQWITNNRGPAPVYWDPAKGHPRNGGWKVLVVVFTDGEENSSKEWHIHNPMKADDRYDLGGLIQWKQNEDWEFMFLGTGGSAWLERTFGQYVAADHFAGYRATEGAHRHTYGALSASLTSTRNTGTFDTSNFAQEQSSTTEQK